MSERAERFVDASVAAEFFGYPVARDDRGRPLPVAQNPGLHAFYERVRRTRLPVHRLGRSLRFRLSELEPYVVEAGLAAPPPNGGRRSQLSARAVAAARDDFKRLTVRGRPM